ncbi:MAG TPA: hypothetical protein VIQ76_06440 [Propionibacteriaceae bacterium]|jgi:uncharacterized glyoxalase superfamily protein PhnB
MMADPIPEVDVEPPTHQAARRVAAPGGHRDAVADAAVRNGAQLDRGPESSSHGQSATFHDPFGHRWMISS